MQAHNITKNENRSRKGTGRKVLKQLMYRIVTWCSQNYMINNCFYHTIQYQGKCGLIECYSYSVLLLPIALNYKAFTHNCTYIVQHCSNALPYCWVWINEFETINDSVSVVFPQSSCPWAFLWYWEDHWPPLRTLRCCRPSCSILFKSNDNGAKATTSSGHSVRH